MYPGLNGIYQIVMLLFIKYPGIFKVICESYIPASVGTDIKTDTSTTPTTR